MIERKTLIYGLRDPRDGVIRYVGRTVDPFNRMLAHLFHKEKTQKGQWIRELIKSNLYPTMVVLQAVEHWQASTAEREWIIRYGDELLNVRLPGGQIKAKKPKAREEDAELGDKAVDDRFAIYGPLVKAFLLYKNGKPSGTRVVVEMAESQGWPEFWVNPMQEEGSV